ncbi:unnamed protein product, partial [Oikopleura dioica]
VFKCLLMERYQGCYSRFMWQFLAPGTAGQRFRWYWL